MTVNMHLILCEKHCSKRYLLTYLAFKTTYEVGIYFYFTVDEKKER